MTKSTVRLGVFRPPMYTKIYIGAFTIISVNDSQFYSKLDENVTYMGPN